MEQINEDYDNIFHERVNVLMDQGYLGFKVNKVSGSKETDEFIVETINHKGITLQAKGETKEEAFKKMVDLIDITIENQ